MAAAGLIGTVAAPDATVTGPPVPRLIAELVTVAERLAPLHVVGMPVNTTAVTVLFVIVKFGSNPVIVPQVATVALPAPSVFDDVVADRAAAALGTSRTPTTQATTTQDRPRNRIARSDRCPD